MQNDLVIDQLDNGLKILLKEIHTSPLVSTWIWYDVGLRNEKPGKTGMSHWVEHMQFKGTPRFPSEILDRTISRLGGSWNAFTHLDWTTYFETLPSNACEIALELEADRMINSVFDPEEVELERTVVISEREGAENHPTFLLNEAVQLAGLTHHPYRYEVAGEKEALVQITREDLFSHYHTYYQPANATFCVSGDFDSAEMQQKIRQYFQFIPSQPKATLVLPDDPRPQSEQRIDLSGPGDTIFIQVSFPAPKADSDDFFTLSILDSLLSGPSGLNMFGSGSVGQKTSRLYQSLVENEMAISVGGSLQATIDPYLYSIFMTLHPTTSVEGLVKSLDEEINSLQEKLASWEEIHKAVKQAKALFAYGSENITNQGFWLGYANAFASYQWFMDYIDRLSSVSPADVQQIAQKYLNKNKRVVGVYRPNHNQKR